MAGKRQRAAALHMGAELWSASGLWRFAPPWGGGRARGGEGTLAGKRQRAAALHMGAELWSAPGLWRFAPAWGDERARGGEGDGGGKAAGGCRTPH
jgi:hypothetical protein